MQRSRAWLKRHTGDTAGRFNHSGGWTRGDRRRNPPPQPRLVEDGRKTRRTASREGSSLSLSGFYTSDSLSVMLRSNAFPSHRVLFLRRRDLNMRLISQAKWILGLFLSRWRKTKEIWVRWLHGSTGGGYQLRSCNYKHLFDLFIEVFVAFVFVTSFSKKEWNRKKIFVLSVSNHLFLHYGLEK